MLANDLGNMWMLMVDVGGEEEEDWDLIDDLDDHDDYVAGAPRAVHALLQGGH